MFLIPVIEPLKIVSTVLCFENSFEYPSPIVSFTLKNKMIKKQNATKHNSVCTLVFYFYKSTFTVF